MCQNLSCINNYFLYLLLIARVIPFQVARQFMKKIPIQGVGHIG